jgi:hypothetical protein
MFYLSSTVSIRHNIVLTNVLGTGLLALLSKHLIDLRQIQKISKYMIIAWRILFITGAFLFSRYQELFW